MSLLNTSQAKWMKKHSNSPWNVLFTNFGQDDAMITKLMVYESVSFADNLLSPSLGLFSGENLVIRSETILLAKMHFYHLVTKSATVHNLFYGYIHELWSNHYHNDLETANLALEQMHSVEKWYLTWYYDYYKEESGSFVPVIKEYCNRASRVKITDGEPILTCSAEVLHQHAAKLLVDMHIEFMAEIK